MKAFILNKPGNYKDLKLTDIENPKAKKNEVVIRHKAIGINHFDVCFRNGSYRVDNFPAILGLEGCGIIEEIGSEVKDYRVGERVAYATGGIGSYAEKRAINQQFLVTPPDSLSDVQVAGSLLKGLMAHTLLYRAYIASRAKKILIHSVAGGVGHIMCQWAKYLGLEIIGTVGSDEKISFAKSLGCDHVINYKNKDFLAEVDFVTKSGGVGIVYDGVGKDTILKSISCLWPMGVCISYGEASGPAPAIDLNHLLFNSLYITRPTLALYKAPRVELVLSANEVFKNIEKGVIKPSLTSYKFTDLPLTHKNLEERKNKGSLVVTLP